MNSPREDSLFGKRRFDPCRVLFPKKWKELTIEEQREWIENYFVPKRKIPEPILRRNDRIEKGMIKLESGVKLKLLRSINGEEILKMRRNCSKKA